MYYSKEKMEQVEDEKETLIRENQLLREKNDKLRESCLLYKAETEELTLRVQNITDTH